jgi:type I restriction-modification system DNA methylase subunit
MQAVKRVDKPEKLAQAMSVLTDSLEEQQEDFLGKFMSEMSMNDKSYRGQCFTPTDVCKMMAKLTFHDMLQEKLDHRLLIQEPACGCGAMVIAATEELRERGLGPLDFYFVAVDVDSRCSSAAFIQFTLLDIPATVIHGNTLTLEQWSSWDTLRAVLTPFYRKTNQTSQPAKERDSVKSEQREVQLTLF